MRAALIHTGKFAATTKHGGRKLLVLISVMIFSAGVALPGQPAKPIVKDAGQASPLERSFWVHASLGLMTQRNYFGPDFPATVMPWQTQVERAARLLTTTYAANRLYLIYHREVPVEEARTLFRWWRKACPQSVEIVPALVLRMYDRARTPVFAADELASVAEFFRDTINAHHLAIYDIAAQRDLGTAAPILDRLFPAGLIRLGLQPGEALDAPFTAAVADTWSALCHGRRNTEDWLQPGFGADTLRQWVKARNPGSRPVAWNLVTVAWDYNSTPRGGYPGYDDAEKNMPLPAGRNRAAMRIMRDTAKLRLLAGFSSDLYILHENSRSAPHDGRAKSFYECLKRGEDYRGYYAAPFQEIVTLYAEIRSHGE
ncbi:MAG: hypothetical protein HZA89_08370 [Verrucomicrobia bacterium]|nr:hypothetical protein [Verrucomicrobiota bacterium]